MLPDAGISSILPESLQLLLVLVCDVCPKGSPTSEAVASFAKWTPYH